jgi:RNA polymerase sigma-70 factor, ECF subfamily
MESKNRYDGVEAYAVTKIRFQARQLARTRVLAASDVEDIEQNLMLDLLKRMPAFDPSKSSKNTFIARVVENHAATLIKAALAEKRGAAITHESLHSVIHDGVGEPIELGDTIPTERGLWNTTERDWDEVIDLRHDLIHAMGGLPPDLVTLCRRLSVGTVTEVSRATGMSRSSIYDGIAKIRAVLKETGFSNYR